MPTVHADEASTGPCSGDWAEMPVQHRVAPDTRLSLPSVRCSVQNWSKDKVLNCNPLKP